MFDIYPLRAFTDNYIWVIRRHSDIVVIDPGQSLPVLEHIRNHHYHLQAILITHHHQDHVGGVEALIQAHKKHIPVFGPSKEANTIVEVSLSENDTVVLFDNQITLRVIDIPGHTLGHIAYFCENLSTPWLFCGDTLFSGGCGRIFEGTARQMYRSLRKIASLPLNTQVYCAHEYTAANLAFACNVLPDDVALQQHAARILSMRAKALCTLPSTLAIENEMNIFLRTEEKNLRKAVSRHFGHPIEAGEKTFEALRRWKDMS